MKKGQATEVLLYIAGGIIAALAVYYGISSAMNLQSKGQAATIEILKSTMKEDVARVSGQFGSNRTFSYNIGPDYNQICFSDTSKNIQITKDSRVPIIINDSAASNSTNNVFLFGAKTDAFYAGEIRICNKNVTCFSASQGIANVKIYGGGGYALLEPCAAVLVPVPICTNLVPLDLIQQVDVPENAQPLDIRAIASNPSGVEGDISIKWITKDSSGNPYSDQDTTISSGEETDVPSINPTEFKSYTFTMIATNEFDRQCSLKFTRQIAPYGKTIPEALITKPEGTSIQPGITSFEGIGNDSSPGMLSGEWDFGDVSNIEFCSPSSSSRIANQSYACEKSHPYTQRSTTVLVKFTVTNRVTGMSSTDERRYFIGNQPPSIALIYPGIEGSDNHLISFKNADETEPVGFNFTPTDPEGSPMTCELLIDANTYPIANTIASGTETTQTEQISLPTALDVDAEHFWAVSCADELGAVGNSETRRFYIRRVAPLPSLKCVILPNSCGTLTPILSISSLTNAHASIFTDQSNPNSYSNLLCCNLTLQGEVPAQNYLNAPGSSCANPFITLSGPSNAHAASGSDPAYGIITKLCFQQSLNPPASIACSVKTLCAEDETCLVALSGSAPTYVNSHVSDCLAGYSNKICCKAS